MIREVIVALAGFESELLTALEKCVDLKYFVHPSEEVMLGKIVSFSKKFRFLKKFIDTNRNPIPKYGEPRDFQAPAGLYVQAYCVGMDEALDPYRSEILSLEQQALQKPEISLTYVSAVIHKYLLVFELLESLSKQILLGKVHGCQILQMLHENALHGIEDSTTYLNCILRRCYTVFLRQCMSWLINGMLTDPFDEFIIRKSEDKADAVVESDSSIVTAANELNLVDENASERYEIAIAYVPVFINYTLANDMLFVGQIVEILNENPHNDLELNDVRESSIFVHKHKYFFEQFVSLKNEKQIDVKKLGDLVHEIRTCVVEHLWRVAVEEENLYEELQLLKDVYLLGFGQFFNEFLREASVFSLHLAKIRGPQISGLFLNLNHAMLDVASTHLPVDEKVLSAFKFKMSEDCAPENTDVVWSSVHLQYTPKWPLDLIFTPVAIEHYNKLFRFLLRVRRCHIELHNVWKKDIKSKTRRFGKAWKLRNEMMFLINNLQFYLQVDVIETEYNDLVFECRKIKDFKQIEKLHNMFLLNVLSHSFLLDVPFYDVLLKNIRICEKFCLLSAKGFENHEQEINELDKSFQKYKSVFMCFLAEYQSQPFKQHAAKLLLRLDFNNWVHNSIVDGLHLIIFFKNPVEKATVVRLVDEGTVMLFPQISFFFKYLFIFICLNRRSYAVLRSLIQTIIASRNLTSLKKMKVGPIKK